MIGRSAGIELAVGGVGAQRRRQVGAGRIDRRLHVARRAVDVAVDVELQHDLGGAHRAARGHLVDVGDGAQMPFQRRRHLVDIVSGLAPGMLALTAMVGMSMLGSGATGSRK